MKDTQLRGICPMCGREWAVLKSGRMSKHGYTLEGGWFNGVCPGDDYEPLQVNRERPGKEWDKIEKDCHGMRALAVSYQLGEKHPTNGNSGPYKVIGKVGGRSIWGYDQKPWDELKPFEQHDALRSAISGLNNRADAGLSFVKQMRHLADEVHGKPLREVSPDKKGPLMHAEGWTHRVTACGRRTEPMSFRGPYLRTTKDWSQVTCEKCLKDKPVNT
jgi:hypothetical protein